MLPQVILKLLLPKVLDHLMMVFKLDKVLDYVELPNEADKKIEMLQDEVDLLRNVAHPPVIAVERIEEIEKKLDMIDIILEEAVVDVIDDSQAADA
jgi:hypothetical protein|tara:strand:+ start:2825 stop:3112 length:288 start_codon:yes stop_codon:yes gene_type:complete